MTRGYRRMRSSRRPGTACVAAHGADQRGDDAPDRGTRATRSARDRAGPEGLLTLVCLTCGNHKYFDDAPPATVTCERCGGTVFRNFFTPTERDEATISQLEQTARSIALDEESPDISQDELRDLNNP
jgi:ribosomal protein S27E